MNTRNLMMIGAAVAIIGGSADAAELSKSSGADLWVQSQKGGYTVEYVSDGTTVGLQFDVHDKNIKEGSFQCGPSLAASHIASCTLHADEGFLRVVVFSMTNALVPDGSLLQVSTTSGAQKLRTAAKASATLGNVVFSDIQGQDVTPAHLKDSK